MTRTGSLRLRLLVGGAILVTLALAATGVALSTLFRRHVTAQLDTELTNQLNALTTALQRRDDGTFSLRVEPADPRFHEAYGGRYWQIEPQDAQALRSRSLWDRELGRAGPLPAPGELHRYQEEVSGLGELRVVERLVHFSERPIEPIRIAVALPSAEIDAVARRLDRLLAITLALLAVALVATSALQVTIGLTPLARLGQALVRVRSGTSGRLEGEYPRELAGLVDELNGLLAQQAQLIERARAQAGDLAHGLKTSLQLILIEADRLDDHDREHARVIHDQATRMQMVIERHLARARARGRLRLAGPGVDVASTIAALLRVQMPLAALRDVAIEAEIASSHRFAGDRADLEEIVGNLLDNACKWARSRVRLTSRLRGAQLCIEVEDDGPGLDEAHRQRVFVRGQRLDEHIPGSGLGLAIVQELVEACGGTIRLTASTMGGLATAIELPGSSEGFRPGWTA